jgi:hypothetical protein
LRGNGARQSQSTRKRDGLPALQVVNEAFILTIRYVAVNDFFALQHSWGWQRRASCLLSLATERKKQQPRNLAVAGVAGGQKTPWWALC